jgi:hypothetical protein
LRTADKPGIRTAPDQADRQAGEHRTLRHPATFLLTLDETFDIGQRVNVTRYRDVLQPIEVIRT